MMASTVIIISAINTTALGKRERIFSFIYFSSIPQFVLNHLPELFVRGNPTSPQPFLDYHTIVNVAWTRRVKPHLRLLGGDLTQLFQQI